MAEYCKNMSLWKQGAEAKLYKTDFFGKPCIVKERFSKAYRHPEIDKQLTRKRFSQEVRSLQRCRKIGVPTPCIFFTDTINSVLILEKIDGITVREHINETRKTSSSNSYEGLDEVVRSVGMLLAKMHDHDIIHGDLTTSNMIIKFNTSCDFIIYMIDFGLATSSFLPEDKAVDLYVLERAFLSSHPNSEKLFFELIDSYKNSSSKSTPVLTKLDEVRQRGRKRSMVG